MAMCTAHFVTQDLEGQGIWPVFECHINWWGGGKTWPCVQPILWLSATGTWNLTRDSDKRINWWDRWELTSFRPCSHTQKGNTFHRNPPVPGLVRVGIWQHGRYLLCRDYVIVITYCAKAFCNGPFYCLLNYYCPALTITIVWYIQLVIGLWPRTVGIYIH